MPKHHTVTRFQGRAGDFGKTEKEPSRRQLRRALAKARRRGNRQMEAEFQAMLDAMTLDSTLDLVVATLDRIAGPNREKA